MEEALNTSSERYHELPQPDQIPEREREDAMGAYLMMFAAVAVALPLPVINLIAAIIYYFVNRRKSRFVHFHSLQSLLAQLPTTLMSWGLLIWAIRIWILDLNEVNDYFKGYIIATVIANLVYFVFSLVAAVRARKGRIYYLVFFGRISYEVVFSKSRSFSYQNGETATTLNKPPA